MKRYLEIGPGPKLHEFGGHPHTVDVLNWKPDSEGAERWGWPLNTDSQRYDGIFAAHVIEHVPWSRTNVALSEAFRILKPGGTIELWTPDLAYLVRCYQEARCGDSWRRMNRQDDPMRWFLGRLYTYGPGEENWHHAAFDEPYLTKCLEQAGFSVVTRLPRRKHRHAASELGVRAQR